MVGMTLSLSSTAPRMSRAWVVLEASGAAAVCGITWLAWSLSGRGYFWPRWVWFGVATALTAEFLVRTVLGVRPGRRRWLASGRAASGLLAAVDVVVWLLSGGGFFWPMFIIVPLAGAVGAHTWIVGRLPNEREEELTERVGTLARSRQVALDGQAAELKRVERDLHDGTQARIVSLALTLGMAEDVIHKDPQAAARLLGEARSTASGALDDLRAVMQRIHPAVLSDRGLVPAVRALALDLALPVTVTGEFPPGLPPPVQSALYFAIAECLANVVKHSHATVAGVTFGADGSDLTVVVSDDGVGGADLTRGTGMRGIIHRLETVDARLDVASPRGGPTRATITLPATGSARSGTTEGVEREQ